MRRFVLVISLLGLLIAAQTAQADWTPAKRLTWTPGHSFSPAIAVGSNNRIHVVWYDNTSGNYEIYYKQSTNGGTSWSAHKRLTWTAGDSSYPAIATDSTQTIHVVWHDTTPGYADIYYRRSPDGGTTWNAVQRLTWTSSKSYDPALAVDSNDKIHLLWRDSPSGNIDIYHKRSTNGGLTWSAAKRITWTADETFGPAISAASDNKIHLVYPDDSSGDRQLYYMVSSAGGLTWSSPKRLTWSSGDSLEPALTLGSGNTLRLVWYGETATSLEVYYKKSPDGGATWTPAQRLTWASGSSSMPAIAVDSSDEIHIVWQGPSTTGNDEIYHKSSSDGGATWSAVKRLTWASGWSNSPALAIDSAKTIHLVWRDDPSGNVEIYYKHGN